MMRVAIVDDDPIVCSSLSTILKATGTADIAWTAYDGETAVGQYEEDNPDVLLIDVQMPVMDGLAASRKIVDAHPNAKILILTTFADESYIAEALEIGTKGYLIKQDVSSVIPAVQSVMAGQVVMGAQVLRKLHVNKASQTQRHVSQAGDNGENRFSGRFANLTERERDVMQLVAEGYDNREIAAKLFLSEGTVAIVSAIFSRKRTLRIVRNLRSNGSHANRKPSINGKLIKTNNVFSACVGDRPSTRR